MENKKIVIKIKGIKEYVIENSNPTFDDLIQDLVMNVEKADLESIEVTSEDDNFDSEGFSGILKQSIQEYKDKAILEIESINKIKDTIKKEKDRLNTLKEEE